ncbi:site-specific integrase, partial [Myxococcota bacterium]|nr:site-specific integrase [Myxococcota bacterium]
DCQMSPVKEQPQISYPEGINRLEDGRWVIRVQAIHSKTGQRKERKRVLSETMTLSQVEDARQHLKAQIERAAPNLLSQRLTFNDYAELWLRVKAERVRASTAEHYLLALHRWILPHIGPLLIAHFNRRDALAWVAEVERARMDNGQPYSRHTTSGWWRVFCHFVRDAAADLGVPDPIVRVRAPRGPSGLRRQRQTLTAEELRALLDAARATFPSRYAEIYTLALTGMRPGELYALRWLDFDEVRGRIIIRHAHRRGIVGPTKTDEPREVALSTEGRHVLRLHFSAQVEACRLASDLIFPSSTGGYRLPESLHKPLRALSKDLQLPVSVGPLILRRTFNTLMLENGVDHVVLRAMMGHSDESMTQRYAGISLDEKRRVVNALEERMGRP